MSRTCPYMNFNVSFKPIEGVTQKFINNAQSVLITSFGNPEILPIPDTVPDDVPRVIATSYDKCSQLILTKVNCSLTTNFEGDSSINLEKCTAYFNEKVATVQQMVRMLGDADLECQFLGITVGLIFDKDNAVNLLRKSITKLQMEDLCDIDLQITRVIEERYYVNIRIANARLFGKEINPMVCGYLNNVQRSGIRVTIDINNRYAFNSGLVKSKACDLNEIEKIRTIVADTINSLPNVFGEGVFDDC